MMIMRAILVVACLAVHQVNSNVVPSKLNIANEIPSAVLPVEFASNEVDTEKFDLTKSNLEVGNITAMSTILSSVRVLHDGFFNESVSEDVVYHGNTSTRITAIRATEVGETQHAFSYLLSGGLGSNYAIVRIISSWGNGFDYVVDFWGF